MTGLWNMKSPTFETTCCKIYFYDWFGLELLLKAWKNFFKESVFTYFGAAPAANRWNNVPTMGKPLTSGISFRPTPPSLGCFWSISRRLYLLCLLLQLRWRISVNTNNNFNHKYLKKSRIIDKIIWIASLILCVFEIISKLLWFSLEGWWAGKGLF